MKKTTKILLLMAGIIGAHVNLMGMYGSYGYSRPATFRCGVCTEDVNIYQRFTFGCNHSFCQDCIRDNFDFKLSQKLPSDSLTCMQTGCNRVITQAELEQMRHFAGDQVRQINEIRRRRRMDNGVQLPEHIRNSEAYKENERLVGQQLHCPRCHAPIERNGGCNHITCKSLKTDGTPCNYEFCYLCLRQWPHTGKLCDLYGGIPQWGNQQAAAYYAAPPGNTPPGGGGSFWKKVAVVGGCAAAGYLFYRWYTGDTKKSEKIRKREERLAALRAQAAKGR